MPSPSPAPSYAAVLRTRYACRTFGAALLGRLSYGTVFLSLVLAAAEATGSYAVAGTVTALFGLSGVLLAPARAALVDRYGPRRALPPMAAAYALLLCALALVTSGTHPSGALLAILAVAAGAGTPPLGPVMRTVWRDLVPDPPLLRRAYSLDAVAEELLFVAGPLLAGLLARATAAPAGLVASAGLVLAGTLALVSSPAVRGAGPAGTARATPGAPSGDPDPGAAPGRSHRRRLPADPGLRAAMAAAAGVGMCLGALELLVIALADEQGRPETVAWAMAALSAGSAIGGLVHGAVPWRAPGRSRLALLAAAQGLVVAPMGLAPHPYLLVAWAAFGGLFVAPALTTAYLLADDSAGRDGRHRAGAWVNTAFNAGSAGATAAAGLLVGRLPLPLCFALAAVPAVLSAAAVRYAFRRPSARLPRRAGPAPRPAAARRRRGAPGAGPWDGSRKRVWRGARRSTHGGARSHPRSRLESSMTVRRVVPNIRSEAVEESRTFYGRLGFEEVMNHGWIVTLASPASPLAQLSLMTEDKTAPVIPDLSVEVDDVDAAYAAMRDSGAEIVHPLRDEEWGVRRFFVRDPDGRVVNVLGHR